MRDNQNADLAAARARIELEKVHHDIGMSRMELTIEGREFAYWTKVDNISVLRIGQDDNVAVPVSGRKNSRKFDIINISTFELVCQVNSEEVHNWLGRAHARDNQEG